MKYVIFKRNSITVSLLRSASLYIENIEFFGPDLSSHYLHHFKNFKMKKINLSGAFILLSLSVALSSCEAIAGIFKAGMGFGIFLVIAVVAIIVFVVVKAGRKKS